MPPIQVAGNWNISAYESALINSFSELPVIVVMNHEIPQGRGAPEFTDTPGKEFLGAEKDTTEVLQDRPGRVMVEKNSPKAVQERDDFLWFIDVVLLIVSPHGHTIEEIAATALTETSC
jgi:hypothetical protein